MEEIQIEYQTENQIAVWLRCYEHIVSASVTVR